MAHSASGYRPIFWVIVLSGLLCFVSMNLMTWSLPLYVKQAVTTPALVGVVMGSGGVIAIALRPFIGQWGDRNGRRRLLLLGAGGFVLGPLLFFLSPSLVLVFAGRLAQGAGISLFTSGFYALVADIAPRGRRGQAIGLAALGSPMSLILGPRLGVSIQAHSGFPALFAASAGVGVLALALLLLAPARSLRGAPSAVVDYRFGDALRSRRLSAMLAAVLAISLAYGAAMTFIPLYATERGIPNGSLFHIAFGAALVLVGIAAGHLSDRVGRTWVIAPGMVGLAACLALLQYAGSLPALLAVGVVWGLCSGAAKTALDAYTIDCAPASGRGSAVGLEYLVFDLGAGLGVMPLGALAGAIGYGWMCAVVGGVCLVGLVAYLVIARRNGIEAAAAGCAGSARHEGVEPAPARQG